MQNKYKYIMNFQKVLRCNFLQITKVFRFSSHSSSRGICIFNNTNRFTVAPIRPILNSVVREYCTPTAIHQISTNIAKDVILYKYDNAKFYRLLMLCAVSQYMFWGYLSYMVFTFLKDAPVDRSMITEDSPWYMKINFGTNIFRNSLGTSCLLIGCGMLFAAYMYTIRSVRYLVLHKGGEHISFVTYNILGANRIMKVPVNCISCTKSRHAVSTTLPIKVKRVWMFFILDMRGEFRNPKLFDYTAGVYRKLK